MRRLRILVLGEINISRYRLYFLHGNDSSCLDSSFREQEDSFAKLGERGVRHGVLHATLLALSLKVHVVLVSFPHLHSSN